MSELDKQTVHPADLKRGDIVSLNHYPYKPMEVEAVYPNGDIRLKTYFDKRFGSEGISQRFTLDKFVAAGYIQLKK